jgi:hypothetical protein
MREREENILTSIVFRIELFFYISRFKRMELAASSCVRDAENVSLLLAYPGAFEY